MSSNGDTEYLSKVLQNDPIGAPREARDLLCRRRADEDDVALGGQ
jgi:hypothetical protein